MHKKISVLLAALLIILLTAPTLAASKTIKTNQIGQYGDFDYELWRDKGEALMILNEDGTFECSWDKTKTGNILFRTGKKLNSSKTHDQIGTFSLTYGCDYKPDGNSYLCVYGWSVSPLIEFYVVDAWGSWRPPGGTSLGQVEIDGGTYDIYEATRVQMPSIQGTKTFQQYFSVRTEKRTEGTISITEHFKAWKALGLDLGKMYEVSFCVEGYMSSGAANVYSNQLTIGTTTIGTVKDSPTATPAPTEEPSATPSATPAPTEEPSATPSATPEPTETPKEAPSLSTADTWALTGIQEAYDKGFIPSDLQSNYKKVITREEFCRMAVQWVEYRTGKTISELIADKGLTVRQDAFSDTKDPYILAAYTLDIIAGTVAPTATASGKFDPNGQFNRQQAATMVMNTCKVVGMDTANPPVSDFLDLNDADSWARAGINFVRDNKIMGGTSTDPLKPVFSPKTTYSRQESIVMFNNIQ